MAILKRSQFKGFSSKWANALAGVAAFSGAATLIGAGGLQAVQVADGTVFFDRPPLFGEATTTRDGAGRPSPAYYFTLSVPQDAGEPLQRVVIAQRDGDSAFREVEFEPEDTQAFVGANRRGEALPLGEVTWDDGSNTLSIEFDPPVAPGTPVALRLEAERNPRRGGVYLFGVTVFPAGERSHGQFIGYGRLHFYDNSDSDIFSRFRHRRHRHR